MYDCIRLSNEQGYLSWFLDQDQRVPLLFNDNKSALALAQTSVATKRSKHMDLRLHLVRDFCRDLCYCNTKINCADPLTKAVATEKYLQIFIAPSGHEILAEAHCVHVDF